VEFTRVNERWSRGYNEVLASKRIFEMGSKDYAWVRADALTLQRPLQCDIYGLSPLASFVYYA